MSILTGAFGALGTALNETLYSPFCFLNFSIEVEEEELSKGSLHLRASPKPQKPQKEMY